MPSFRCTNARLVTPDEVLHGSLRTEDGLIMDIDSDTASPGVLDFEGD